MADDDDDWLHDTLRQRFWYWSCSWHWRLAPRNVTLRVCFPVCKATSIALWRPYRRRLLTIISTGTGCRDTERAESQDAGNWAAEGAEEVRNCEGWPLSNQLGSGGIVSSPAGSQMHFGDFFLRKRLW